jgi:hypothetical protein
MKLLHRIITISVISVQLFYCCASQAQDQLQQLKDKNRMAARFTAATADSALILSKEVISMGEAALGGTGERDSILHEIMKAHGFIAQVHTDRGDYSMMMKHSLEALKLARQIHDTASAIEYLSGIGSAYKYLQDRKRALNYYH